MRRSHPTSKLDVIGQLCLPSVEAVANTVESKRTTDILHDFPNPNVLNDKIEILAIQNEDEHKAMLLVQKHMLESAARQSSIDANRIEQLNEILKNLRKSFINSNDFLRSCEDKRLQALSLVSDEKQRHADLKSHNIELKNSIDIMQEFRGTLAKTVQELEPYETIIEEAAHGHETWNSSRDVMNSCDAMMLAQDEIIKMKDDKTKEIETVRRNIVKMTSDATTAILGMNLTFNELEKDLGQARDDCAHWEKLLVRIKDCVIENDLTTERMVDEINKLYRLLCKRRRIHPVISDHTMENRLNFIKDEAYILSEVLKECESSKILKKKKKPKIRLNI